MGGSRTNLFRTKSVRPSRLVVRPQASKADASAEPSQKIGFRCLRQACQCSTARVVANTFSRLVAGLHMQDASSMSVVSCRWDATLQRWVRDKRVSGEVWANVPTMKPKTGERCCSCALSAACACVIVLFAYADRVMTCQAWSTPSGRWCTRHSWRKTCRPCRLKR